jgi:hypothetical protein
MGCGGITVGVRERVSTEFQSYRQDATGNHSFDVEYVFWAIVTVIQVYPERSGIVIKYAG